MNGLLHGCKRKPLVAFHKNLAFSNMPNHDLLSADGTFCGSLVEYFLRSFPAIRAESIRYVPAFSEDLI